MIGYIEYINPIFDIGPGIRFLISMKSNKIEISSDLLHRKILKYRHFYTDGGITIVDIDLSQKDFVIDLLKKCKMTNLSTCLVLDEVLDDKDILRYVDIIEYKKV